MTTSDSVSALLEDLDAVVQGAIDEDSRIGYFAAVYRTVTAAVEEGVAEDFFDDPQRMERLTVVFAQRYLDALEAWQSHEPTTHSWQVALEATRRWRPVALQHVVAGINAHINLDLGVAAASVAPGGQLPDLRRDFDRVNEILGAEVEMIQSSLARASPWMGLLDLVGGHSDEQLLRFSLERARAGAWALASELAPLPRGAWSGPIGVRDRITAELGRRVLNPGVLQAPLLLIRARESDDVAGTIRLLNGLPQPSLQAVEQRLGRRPGAESEQT